MPRGQYDRTASAARPKGNAFQKLIALAERERDAARIKLSAAEHHADCAHQRRLKAARNEHDSWVKMVERLAGTLTVPTPAVPANGNGHADIGDRRRKPGPVLSTGRQSAFDRCPGLPGRPCTNSKPRESELCGRCHQMKFMAPVPA